MQQASEETIKYIVHEAPVPLKFLLMILQGADVNVNEALRLTFENIDFERRSLLVASARYPGVIREVRMTERLTRALQLYYKYGNYEVDDRGFAPIFPYTRSEAESEWRKLKRKLRLGHLIADYSLTDFRIDCELLGMNDPSTY